MPRDAEATTRESLNLSPIPYDLVISQAPVRLIPNFGSSVTTRHDSAHSREETDAEKRFRIMRQNMSFHDPLTVVRNSMRPKRKKNKKTPAQIQAKKNRRKAARDRKRDARLADAAHLNVGRPCKFAVYGCNERVVNEEDFHERHCIKYCSPKINSYWKAIRSHEKQYRPDFKVWPLVRKYASDYGSPATGSNIGHEVPFVVPAKACWVGGEIPTVEEINADILVPEAVVDRTTFFGKKFVDFDRIKTQVQNTEHTPAEVEGLVGLQPYAIFQRYNFRLPEPLHGWYTKPAASVTMNVTPTFVRTDIHIDMGMSTISVHHGGLVSIWLIWPATLYNWDLYYTQRHCKRLQDPAETSCFERIAKDLYGGQVVILEPGDALFLPPGWLSFSCTLQGGYMTKIMITAPEQLSYAFTCLSHELEYFESGNWGELEANILFFMNSLCDYLKDSDKDIALYAARTWIRLMDMLTTTAKSGYIIGHRITNKVSEVLDQIFDCESSIDCPCGNMSSRFGVHFLAHSLGKYGSVRGRC